MTNDQIAELERVIVRADTVVADDDLGWSYQQLAAAIPRLLEQRRQLLDALRALIDGFDHVANCRECGEMSAESCAGGGGGPALEARAQAQAALGAAGRMDEPQVSAAQPPLKAVEIPAIPDSKG